jgi:hypothetical protein
VSGIFVFIIVIIGFNIAVRLYLRSRRGPRGRLGGRMGVRPPGYGQWQQDGAYGYDSNGSPIEPGFGQPGLGGQPGGPHGSGGHHGGFGGGHGGGGFGGHGGGHSGGGGDAGGGGHHH